MGAWDKRDVNFRGEGIGNRNAVLQRFSFYLDIYSVLYFDSHGRVLSEIFWAISLSFSLCVGLKLKNLCKEYNQGHLWEKNKLLVKQAAVSIRKIICTSAVYTRRELQRSLVYGLFLTIACVAGGISRASAFVFVAKPWTRVATPWEDWWRV